VTDQIAINLSDMTSTSGSLATAVASTSGISTASAATSAMTAIDNALDQVNSARATFGAMQNRFESVISNLKVAAENQTAAKSRIMDADFAQETANLTRAQILQQAGTAMLAQANAAPQGVLSLLRG
jgi:flagellin